ncbi:MAG: sugar phosphate isomerase/epimerase [Planctomycetes bacterium]|nr:sugar phosphate isomerase/epimerase [Planctomycetota bacterium]
MAGSVIAAQLYTVREFTRTPADISATMKKVAAIGYEAVQLSALGPMDPSELRRVCDGEGLRICATHIGYAAMRDEPQAVIDLHQTYGCPYAGIGGLPAECRNAEGFARFAREASQVARRLAEGGPKFVYHNHSFELERFGPRTGLQILYEDSDPRYFLSELDTYWVQHGGGSPSAWIRRLKGRAPCLHLKDMANQGGAQLMAEVGEGNLDWPDILAAAREAGTEWYIVEQDTCQRDPFESLALSLRNLRAMGLT